MGGVASRKFPSLYSQLRKVSSSVGVQKGKVTFVSLTDRTGTIRDTASKSKVRESLTKNFPASDLRAVGQKRNIKAVVKRRLAISEV